MLIQNLFLPGLLSAVWCAKDPIVMGACAIVLVLAVSMATLFTMLCTTMTAKIELATVSAEERGGQQSLTASTLARLVHCLG
jgi:hypothetical protein